MDYNSKLVEIDRLAVHEARLTDQISALSKEREAAIKARVALQTNKDLTPSERAKVADINSKKARVDHLKEKREALVGARDEKLRLGEYVSKPTDKAYTKHQADIKAVSADIAVAVAEYRSAYDRGGKATSTVLGSL